MSRIELAALTDEQRTNIQTLRTHWSALRLSTAPADRREAEDGLARAYDAVGLPPPRQFVWTGSPHQLARELGQQPRSGAQGKEAAGGNVRGLIYDGAVRRTSAAVDSCVGRGMRAELWRALGDALPSATSRAILQVVNETSDVSPPGLVQALRSLFGNWRQRRRPAWHAMSFGECTFSAHDHSPLPVYQFLHDACGLAEQTHQLSGLWRALASAGWIAAYENKCWITERPDILKVDFQGRLHAEDGPAMAFPDGWKVHIWKGVRVPAAMIENRHAITIGMIDRQRDPVLRRCLIDIMGPARYIEQSDAIRVSQDETGVLWIKTWTDWDRWAAVEVINGTAEPDGTFKHYYLQVPPTVRTAREAVAWTYGMSEREYAHLTIRT